MNIFVFNCGSSSCKCSIYALHETSPSKPLSPLWEGKVEWKDRFQDFSLEAKNRQGAFYQQKASSQDLKENLLSLICLAHQGKTAVLPSLANIDLVGHRIVHGGLRFFESIELSPSIQKQIDEISPLSPLHAPIEKIGREVAKALFPCQKQIAVFDTSFHHAMPLKAKIYPGPYEWSLEGIYRYGFHGINFQYCARRAAHLLQAPLDQLKLLVCHLGSGSSLCAIKQGISLDTTMGFTPLEGMMMGTRSGSIDPGILLHLLIDKKKRPEEVQKVLYEESGLWGLSGVSSDLRDVLAQSQTGHERSSLALDVYLHRLTSLIGSLFFSLEGCDALVFTGGIGENSSWLRKRVCEKLSFLGVHLDLDSNEAAPSSDRCISLVSSSPQVLVIAAQEAFEIALECARFANQGRL